MNETNGTFTNPSKGGKKIPFMQSPIRDNPNLIVPLPHSPRFKGQDNGKWSMFYILPVIFRSRDKYGFEIRARKQYYK
ncbi:hypothetical protein TNCV_2516341 [Trichonephila clavipes]|nr:hypothetical protein TNCV_2516341 [Trichonephila clavipes]